MSIKQRLAKRVNTNRKNHSCKTGDACMGFETVVVRITSGKYRGDYLKVGKTYSGSFFTSQSVSAPVITA